MKHIQNAILHNKDLDKPHATLITVININKGFNKIEHNETFGHGLPRMATQDSSEVSQGKNTYNTVEEQAIKKTRDNYWALLVLCYVLWGRTKTNNRTTRCRILPNTRKTRKPIRKGKKKWVDDLSLWVPIKL